MPCDTPSIRKLAKKKRETAITKGWADCSPNLVAAEADDHKMANMIPIQMNFSRMCSKIQFNNLSLHIQLFRSNLVSGFCQR